MFFGVTLLLTALSSITSLMHAADDAFLLQLSIWTSALACFCAAFLIIQNKKWLLPTSVPMLLAAYVLADSVVRMSSGHRIVDLFR